MNRNSIYDRFCVMKLIQNQKPQLNQYCSMFLLLKKNAFFKNIYWFTIFICDSVSQFNDGTN